MASIQLIFKKIVMEEEGKLQAKKPLQVPKVEGFKNLEEYFTHMIAINGFESQNEILKKEGYTQLGKNLQLLIKFQGNVDKVREQLGKKEDRKKSGWFEGSKEDVKEVMKKEGLYEKYEQIAQLGFDRPRRIYCLLKKFDGNVELVIEKIQYKEEKRHHGRKRRSSRSSSSSGDHGHKHKHGHWRGKHQGQRGSNERQESHEKHKNCKFQDLDEKKKLLHEMGFTNGKKAFKALRRCKGDTERAIQMLIEDQTPQEGSEFQKLKEEFQVKLEELRGQGFYKQPKNVKLLAIFNGDVKKTAEFLKEKFSKCQTTKVVQ